MRISKTYCVKPVSPDFDMEKRILRPRKENARPREEEPRPAKRNRRAQSTIERCNPMDAAESIVRPAKRNRRALTTIERCNPMYAARNSVKVVQVSTQTECCLAATNAQLTQQLIVKNDLLQLKDKKYIEMLEKFFLQKEKLQAQMREKNVEIDQLQQRILAMEQKPLVEVDAESRSHVTVFL